MGAIQFSNNASSLLAASIDDNDTIVQVGSGEGALFPSPGAGQYFKLVAQIADGTFEIMHCTSRAGDLLTVVRGQEGTAAIAWTNGVTRVELRNTKGVMDAMVQKAGDAMTGDLDMGGNEIQDAELTGDTVVTGGQLVGTAVRGALNVTTNEIVVPDDGTRATAGGSPLLVAGDNVMTLMPAGALIMWYGSLGSLPTGWQNCDGTNGTPDMRGAFPRGAGGALSLGASGGDVTSEGTTDAGGGHSHTAAADGHVLTVGELPEHHHRVLSDSNAASTEVVGLANAGGRSVGGRTAVFTTGYSTDAGAGGQIIEDTGEGEEHEHAVSVDAVGDHTHTLDGVPIIPPYKAVYFIMKVA